MSRLAISELLGSVVRGPDGDRLGTIKDVCLDRFSGRADTVRLAVPLASGGDGDVTVPWSQFHFTQAGDSDPDVRLPVRLDILRRFARRTNETPAER